MLKIQEDMRTAKKKDKPSLAGKSKRKTNRQNKTYESQKGKTYIKQDTDETRHGQDNLDKNR